MPVIDDAGSISAGAAGGAGTACGGLDVSDSSERSGDVVRWMEWANCLVSVRFMDLSGMLGG